MNLFGFLGKITHPVKRPGWVETTAYFTGESRRLKRERGGRNPLMMTAAADVREYAVRYFAGDTQRTGWYRFYPGPEPDPEGIKGMTLQIRYKKRRPWIFENISGMDE